MATLLGILLLTAMAAWLVWNVVGALRSGVANAAGVLHPRRKKPLKFWLTILVQAAFALMILAVLVSILQRF